MLRSRGIDCDAWPDFSGEVGDKRIRGRVICGEVRRADGFHGITFWIHVGLAGNFIGLWSGRVYRFPAKRDPVALVVALLRQGELPSGKMPYEFQKTVARKFELVQVE